MQYDDYLNFQDPDAVRRTPEKAQQLHNYKPVRILDGAQGRSFAITMGMYDDAEILPDAGFFVELSEAPDHIKLAAYSEDFSREVQIYGDKAIIKTDYDAIRETATQTVFSPNGDVETLKAPWNNDNGFQAPYEHVSLAHNQHEACHEEWAKYEGLSLEAEEKITARDNHELGR